MRDVLGSYRIFRETACRRRKAITHRGAALPMDGLRLVLQNALPVVAFAHQQRHALDMCGVREHVHRLDFQRAVAQPL